MFWTQIFDLILGIGTLLLQITILGMIVLHHFARSSKLYRWLTTHKTTLAFILALAGVVGSLIYSEVIGFEPCTFCWWQRIFIYPLALILGIASWKKEGALIKKYALSLAGIGVIFALYHTLIQKIAVVATTVNCDALGAVSCSTSYMNVFGYISIPVMSLTILIAIILLLSLKTKTD